MATINCKCVVDIVSNHLRTFKPQFYNKEEQEVERVKIILTHKEDVFSTECQVSVEGFKAMQDGIQIGDTYIGEPTEYTFDMHKNVHILEGYLELELTATNVIFLIKHGWSHSINKGA